MNNRQNVNPQYKFGDSDGFMLTDIDTSESLMLIPCDTAGNFSWTGATRAPLQRNAMQTSNTSNQYSDLEPPWISIPQENWTGGRANDIFTKDTTRYRDGKRCQAAFNEVIYNAPLDYYSEGFERFSISNGSGSVVWKTLKGANRYLAIKVKPKVDFIAGELYIHLRRRGTPKGSLHVQLLENNPQIGTVLAEHEYTTSEVTDTLSEFLKFTFNVELLEAKTYYVKVYADIEENYNSYWQVGCNPKASNNTYFSSDDTKYYFQTANFDLYYRIASAQENKYCKYFIYEQLVFALRQDPKWGAPTLWMNGDIGRASSASNTRLSDNSKSWEDNVYKGARIGLIYRNGAEAQISAWRTIVSNTSTDIIIDEPWDVTPDNTCIYLINDSPHWTYVAGSERFTSMVTDIHVIKGVVYFAQGDYDTVLKMRFTKDGTFQWKTTTIRASFLQSVRDSTALMLYRGRNDGIDNRRCVDRALLLDWLDTPVSWDIVTNAITTIDDRTKTISKTVTTTESEPEEIDVKTNITTTEITRSDKPNYSKKTVYTEKEGTINGQTVVSKHSDTTVLDKLEETEEIEAEGDDPAYTKTTATTSQRTEVKKKERDVEPTPTTNVVTATQVKINGQLVSSETVENNIETSEVIRQGVKIKTTVESSTTTQTSAPEPPIRMSVCLPTRNFENADIDTVQYIIDIGVLTSDNNTGKCTITLQQSQDGHAFSDVQTVIATSDGRWRLFAHCQHKFRRFVITALGTNCTVNNITITTSDELYFENPIYLIDNYGKITRLFEYGSEQAKSLWIFQEGMVSSINKVDNSVDTYTLDRINLDELERTADEWNGKAVSTADVYLTWSWLNGLQRYYNTQLEGKGPDHDEGLPFDRQGRITQIVNYPSNLFISIDGEDGYSCVMQFNQSGWHEIYRAPNKGERIKDMIFQPIYGKRPDRLWLAVGDDMVWLAMPSKILYAIQDPYAEYTHESVLVSSWLTAGMIDVEKLWQSLKIMADNLDGKTCWVEADYQIDEEKEWHPIENLYVKSPSQKENFSDMLSVNGKKLRYRLRLQTTDYHKTPKVNVVVIEAVGRIDIKMSYTFYFRNIKYKRDLNAEFENIEPIEVQNLLDKWANDLKKLRLNSRWLIYDDKLVYLDAVQTSVLNELSEGYIAQITLNEL